MSQRFALGPIKLGSALPSSEQDGRRDAAMPYRIVVSGDFSAGNPGGPLLGRPVRVDLDNLETVFAQFSARLEVPVPGGSIVLQPRSLDDLHPDALFQLGCFAPLRTLRARLANPTSFAAELIELRAFTSDGPKPHEAAAPSGNPSSEPEDEVFERLLGRPRSTPAAPSVSPSVQALFREAAAANLAVASATDQQAAMAALDLVIAAQMNAILHTPAFQALEAAWRGVDFLARRLELDEALQLYVLNLPVGALRTSEGRQALSKALAPREDQSGWELLVADCSFGTTAEDIAALANLAEVAQGAGALLLTAADSSWLDPVGQQGEQSWPPWDEARGRPAAKSMALLTPRFLLRLPYGAKTDPIEAFAFEEMPALAPANYLWGNPALLGAVAMAGAVAEGGGDLTPGGPCEISGLPLHTYREAGEVRMTPCTEHWLSDGDAEVLLGRGLSPVSPRRGSDAVHVRLQSAAA